MIPSTSIIFYATPFDMTDTDLLYPTNGLTKNAFLNDLLTLPHEGYTGFTWERQHQTVRVHARYDQLKKYNYISYVNNNDLEFAYVLDYVYINESVTGVHVYVDFWSTYIDKYQFLPSPIIRQHPASDVMFQNNNPEPVQVERWDCTRVEVGLAEDDDDTVTLLTANNTDTYKNRASDFYAAIAYFAMGNFDSMSQFYSTVQMTPCNAGGVIQANSSVGTRDQATDILSRYAKAGRSSDCLGAYHIPAYFRATATGENLAAIPTTHGNVSIKIDYPIAPLWNKIYTLPQFNRLTATLAGNSRSYDYHFFGKETVRTHDFTFKWSANQSQLGGVVLSPSDYAGGTPGEFSLSSPTWDRVQLSTTQVNESKLVGDTGRLAAGTVKNLLRLDVASGISDAMSYAEQAGQTFEESDIQIGSATGSIAMYNAEYPFISLAHYKPDTAEMDKINLYFCKFGYNCNTETFDIELNSMPICNFVHTAGAIVTGALVPQEFLSKMKATLDIGCTFWHGIANFKATDKLLQNHFGGKP